MLRKDLKRCPLCGGFANAWQWNGGAGIDCENWSLKNDSLHLVGVGAKTLEEAEKLWEQRWPSEDVLMKHYLQGRKDETAERERHLMQTFSP